MKKPLLLGVASALFATATLWGPTLSGTQDRDKRARIPEQFIGAWRLVALDVVDADGKVVHRGDSTGLFVFTREGRLAVQVMDRTPPAAPMRGRSSTPKAATKPRSADSRSTNGRARLRTTSRAAWSAPWSARRCRVPTSSGATSSS